MRSPEEIRFRIRQEAANLWMWLYKPKPKGPPPATPLIGWPSPKDAVEAFRLGSGKDIAEMIVAEAERARKHQFSLLGLQLDASPKIAWRRDWLRNLETGLDYFRRIPYLDPDKAGDHKLIWELNRHQHLMVLAQAWLITGEKSYLDALWADWSDWVTENPFQCGINWASALEVALRSLSWLWVYHWVGAEWNDDRRIRFWEELYRHGLHIEYNLSVYFSPNTHLLGEGVALHALGQACRVERWRKTGSQVVLQQMERQVKPDGSHMEQSSYYHLYSLDFFLLHHILNPGPDEYVQKLAQMLQFASALEGPSERLHFLGDDDGGRLFFPYGRRDQFGRATRITAARVLGIPENSAYPEAAAEQAWWWLGSTKPAEAGRPEEFAWNGSWKLFEDSGLAVIRYGAIHVIFDAGGPGVDGAGHSHADALSLLARHGEEDILIDPGTYTYVGDQEAREWFRSTAAHNTVTIDGANQAQSSGPFRWITRPIVEILAQGQRSERPWIMARCQSQHPDGRTREHQRIVLFDSIGQWLVVWDSAESHGAADQYWHLGGILAPERIHTRNPLREKLTVWRSRVHGQREPNFALKISNRGHGKLSFETVIDLAQVPRSIVKPVQSTADGRQIILGTEGSDWRWEKPI